MSLHPESTAMGRNDGRDDGRWGLILAGGEGARLRPLTRAIVGDDRPKQFCPVLGAETLFERTRRRAALTIPPARTLVALTRSHERFYRPLVAGMPSHCAVVQPEARGTAAAILYGVLRIAVHAPAAAVAILPCDHYVSDDPSFMAHVATAFEAVEARPDVVVLLGIAATRAESEYGWIEPGTPIPGTALLRVNRFVEKPDATLAHVLLAQRCLWNSFVIVARLPALLAVLRRATPALASAFAPLHAQLGTLGERAAVRAVYRDLAPLDFSADVLATRPSNLAVLPVEGVDWCDWGHPERVVSTLAGLGIRPRWAERAVWSA
jgi:mannose-1-phosphate guanylyltransferase